MSPFIGKIYRIYLLHTYKSEEPDSVSKDRNYVNNIFFKNISTLLLLILLLLLCVCVYKVMYKVCECGHAHAMAHMWSENSFWESVLSFHHEFSNQI